MNKEIGDQGDHLNDSYASRSMNRAPDGEQFKKYDEFKEEGNIVSYIFYLILVGLLSLNSYLFISGHWIWGILSMPFTLLLTFMIYSSRFAIREMAYEKGLIIPAIIINTKPIELLVVASMDTYPGQKPILGVLKIKIKNLPNHKIELNEKVPCVSLFRGENKGYRKSFVPRPIAWGYKDASLITQTVNIISKSTPDNRSFHTEWEMLYKLKDKVKKNLKYKSVVFYDKHLNEVIL